MDKIAHLWNVNQFVAKLACPQSKNLQTSYIRSCKRLSTGMQLPCQSFGPATMCSYCGSLWSTIDYKVRIIRGRRCSKSVKKILKAMDTSKDKMPKVRATLAKKSAQNQMNKIVFTCSVCLKSTEMAFTKPGREKLQKLNNVNVEQIQLSHKRKKKKNRDKTAGLNISGTPKPDTESTLNQSKEGSKKRSGYSGNFTTQTPKLKKLDLNRLKNIVSQGVTPPKTKSLHSFLKELC